MNLLLWYELDDDPVDGATDSSGNGHQGACTAMCPPLVAGRIGSGYDFSSAEPMLRVPDHPSFMTPDGFTIMAWIRIDGYPSNLGHVLAKPHGATTDNSFSVGIDDVGRLRNNVSYAGGDSRVVSTVVIGLNEWHHVSYGWDGANLTLYLDGILLPETLSSPPMLWDDHDLLVGGDENSGQPASRFDGVIDDLRFYASPPHSSRYRRSRRPMKWPHLYLLARSPRARSSRSRP